METKLTLKLDQAVISGVKEYAQKNNKSLSKITEDFFRNLIQSEGKDEVYPPIIKKLSGVVSEQDLEKLSMQDDRAAFILRKER